LFQASLKLRMDGVAKRVQTARNATVEKARESQEKAAAAAERKARLDLAKAKKTVELQETLTARAAAVEARTEGCAEGRPKEEDDEDEREAGL
jgi:hypothetical protein